jgi:hypothetical protein
MVARYRTPSGGGKGPRVFTVKLLTADGTEMPLPSVTADTPADAARQVTRAYVEFIRGQIQPPQVVVGGPFGPHTFPTDSTWRGRRRPPDALQLFDPQPPMAAGATAGNKKAALVGGLEN